MKEPAHAIDQCPTNERRSERVHEVKRFEQDYFGNGRLEMFNSATDGLLGRKDAYIPMNMFLDGDAAAAELGRLWQSNAAPPRRKRTAPSYMAGTIRASFPELSVVTEQRTVTPLP
jgi:hypothetical protein